MWCNYRKFGGIVSLLALTLFLPTPGFAQGIITTNDGYFYFTPGYFNNPTYMTSLNYPLTYGAYSTFPYSTLSPGMAGYAPTMAAVGIPALTNVGNYAVGALPLTTAPATQLSYSSLTATNSLPTTNTPLATGPAPAMINVHVPADADVWLQGKKMNQRGTNREFVSPPLDSGTVYSYDVRAIWTENGRQVTQNRQLMVRAGDRQNMTFLAAPSTGARLSQEREFSR